MSGTVGYDDNLVGVGIVEKDKAEDVQLVWAYPSLSPSLSKKVLAHSGLPTPAAEGAGLLRFRYNNFSNDWVHIWAAVLPEDASPLLASSLQAFAVVLVTKQFNPEKYAAISEALWRTYAATASMFCSFPQQQKIKYPPLSLSLFIFFSFFSLLNSFFFFFFFLKKTKRHTSSFGFILGHFPVQPSRVERPGAVLRRG